MSRHILTGTIAVTLGMFFVSGCTQTERGSVISPSHTMMYPGRDAVVTEPPPEPKSEYHGAPPDSALVWIPGYWMRGESNWIWVPGRWETPPQEAVTWVSGQWVESGDGQGWTWVPGHWERN